MKSIADRIHSYSDQHLESILMKRNGYQDAVVIAAIEEAKLRGLIASEDDVNTKYPLIPGDENFAENLLLQVHQNAAFEKVQQHYLWIGYVGIALSIFGVLKGYFFAPFLPGLYLLGIYRCMHQFNQQLYAVLHIISYLLVFGMVFFVGSLFF
jgi:hypothetical protein